MARRRETWRLWLGLQAALFAVQAAIAVVGIAGVQFGVYQQSGDWRALVHTVVLAVGAAIAGPALQSLNTIKAKLEQLISEKWPAAPPVTDAEEPEIGRRPRA